MTRTSGRIILSVILFCTLYTVLRYHVFKGVEWIHFPLYIMNKILSFSGFILLLLSLALEPIYRNQEPQWLETRKLLGRTGLILIIIHILMSFLLFRPEVYDKFFGYDGALNAIGEWSMLFGALGITAHLLLHNSFSNMDEVNDFQRFIRSPVFGISSLAVSALHIAIMGFKGWISPVEWYGGMPPITLVSTFVFIIGVLFFIIRQPKTSENGK